MIQGKSITFSYDEKLKNKVLNKVSFELTKNRITTFVGKSGTGKTTLMKCLTSLNNDYEGVITYGDNDIKSLSGKERAKYIGFVFQNLHLFPHMTVLKNCTQPLKAVFGYSEKHATKVALDTLSLLDMDGYKNSYPGQLSGGQQQKVAIARSLCLNPKVLVFDEPTSALDPESTSQLKDLLLKLNGMGITIVLSSHDVPFIKGVLDRVYLLESGNVVDFFDKNNDKLSENNKISSFLNG